jgi:circadian clock protein KaiB
MTEKDQSSLSEDNYLNEQASDVYRLRLFVTGASPNSSRAITNLKDICETHLKGNYDLEIVDVYQQPLIVEHEQIIALPMLIKNSPGMTRRLIGDMSDTGKVLKGLGIQTEN